MAKDKQRDGAATSRDDSSGPANQTGFGKQGQGGESSRNDQGRSGSAQQDQSGTLSQQGGTNGRNRNQDEERVGDDDSRSVSSPRSPSDAPDEGKGGS